MNSPVAKGLQWVLRLALAGVFIFYGGDKVWDLQGFADSITAYELSPWWAINPTAILLPWLELVAAVVLVFGPWRAEAATLIAGMMVMFIVGVSSAVIRGLDINCGCSVSGGTPVSWNYVGFQTLLLAGAIILIITNCTQRSARPAGTEPTAPQQPA